MSDTPEFGRLDAEAVLGIAGLSAALDAVSRPTDERRLIFAKGENFRHVRHAQVLERWPVIREEWSMRIELARIAAVDRTPGPASFGR